MAVSIGIIVLFGIIIGIMYFAKAPPLFNDPELCSPAFSYSYGQGDNNCTNCINLKSQEISLEQTPMKYIFSLTGEPPQDSGLTGSLLEMIVIAKSNTDQMKINQGYNVDNANNINQMATDLYKNFPDSVKNVMSQPPDILTIPQPSKGNYYVIPSEYSPKEGSCTPTNIQIDSNSAAAPSSWTPGCPTRVKSTSSTKDTSNAIANLNVAGWKDYLKTTPPQFARFFLLRLLESSKVRFDLSTYEDEHGNEPVIYMDGKDEKVDLAKNLGDKASIYRNHLQSPPSALGKAGAGTVKGLFGVCNNQEYKLRKFSRTWGLGIFSFIIIVLLVGLALAGRKKIKTTK